MEAQYLTKIEQRIWDLRDRPYLTPRFIHGEFQTLIENLPYFLKYHNIEAQAYDNIEDRSITIIIPIEALQRSVELIVFYTEEEGQKGRAYYMRTKYPTTALRGLELELKNKEEVSNGEV